MIAWMLYWVAVSAMLGVAALAVERALHLYGRPSRGVWAALLAAVAVAPLALWLGPRRGDAGDGVAAVPLPAIEPLPMAPAAAMDSPAATTLPVDAVLPWMWLVVSTAILGFLALSAIGLVLARRRWPRRMIDGQEVRVAPSTGPAVIGLVRPAIVLPAWLAESDSGTRRLVLDHEREHLRTGDGRLLVLTLAAIVAVPWNPVVWWAHRRLRLAVEVDCDARVLARGHHPRRYAELLLQVGQKGRPMPLAVAISEPRSQLERRIRMFTRPMPHHRLARAIAVGTVAALVPLAAWALPAADAPDRPALDVRAATPSLAEGIDPITVRAEPADTPVVHPQMGDVSGEPAFTPYTVSPELRNRQEFVQLLQQSYPADLRDAGIGGTAILHVLIDTEGVVRDTRVMESTGYPALDDAAQRVMREARFTPARNRDEIVPVWIQLPVTFRTEADRAAAAQPPGDRPEPIYILDGRRVEPRPDIGSDRIEIVEVIRGPAAVERYGEEARGGVVILRTEDPAAVPDTLPPPPAEERGRIGEHPAFTPYTQAPELRNREEFQQALRNRYPDEMRDAGIGGTVIVHVFIDTEGRVANTRVAQSSGYPQLDRAAEEVLRIARFTPARNRDEVVPVWVQLPVTFQTDEARRRSGTPSEYPTDQVAIGTDTLRTPQPERPVDPDSPGGFAEPPVPADPAGFERALMSRYPSTLRDAGIGGTVTVFAFISEHGLTGSVRTVASSGYPALDRAAEQVVRSARFEPARTTRGEPIGSGWRIPVTFPPPR